MRMSVTSEDDVDALSHLALDALLRNGIRPARVIVNGIDQALAPAPTQYSTRTRGEKDGN
jgi:hypothetical protein